MDNGEYEMFRPEIVACNLCNNFQRWSRENDEECKLFHNFIPCT